MISSSNTLTTLQRKPDGSWLAPLYHSLRTLVETWDVFDLAASMTLILLMLYAGDYWYLKRPVTILCAAAILYRPLRCNEFFWLATTTVLAASNYYNWYLIDNHKYLITYWCLSLYLARLSADPARTIAISARYLIGLAFLFATVWKLISPDYLNGAFFHYSLLLDDRFAALTIFLSGLSQTAYLHNHQALQELLAYSSQFHSIQLQSTPQIGMLAQFITWWTISLEGLIALAFLGAHRLFARWRDPLLLLFVLTTYSIAAVIGFGWVLVIMGAVQSTLVWRYSRLFYLTAFFILQIYLTPWQIMLSNILLP
jgi:hypothetical protein